MNEGIFLVALICCALVGAIVSGRHVVEDCPIEEGPARIGCLGTVAVLAFLAFIGGMLLAAIQ